MINWISKLNVFDKIRLWWKFEARYYPRNFSLGIKNLWRWFPVIWKDRDWDQYFIYEMLKTKLKHQAMYIGTTDRHVGAKRDAERMLLCVKLIEIQQEDTYAMEYMDYHNLDVEFTPTDETKQWYEMTGNYTEERYDEYFAKYPRQRKRAQNGELNRYRRAFEEQEDRRIAAMEIAHENQVRSHKLLFKILEENIDRWWD